ncbi:hypothetical protein G6F57_011171 [Rhizopus arrhizus]|uniref:Kinesin motor domain-containing protein n=1 Tax=Rhizopus oryzae TaxID=64495 RepID=A0A9P6X0U3_RHIOR|nr:hypothetical protein G6F24_008559 [Rhizopus arrhizus]KAG1410886.1 hypothetical protein G6F58_008865 [Rhizopus delemar]KAG0782684.1 hypothetical protein G6F21_010976 [Rhizopus arrhizus]KAG0791354.1 hypothetical protein G6F22_006158 [Rhizopus arrhizus]KAG0812267.1 hypothetical protein G6F20_006508 [Rhizopus arrhizus]
MTGTSTSSVRVAVRVRPLTEQERQQQMSITFQPNNQISVSGDKSFTFDYVYPPHSGQQEVFNTCVIPLLNKFLEGYNSTILAYGQTGSGKTYSMGIGIEYTTNEGIVPRFVHSLFQQLHHKQSLLDSFSFQVSVSFLELHQEDLVDLLGDKGFNLTIREDTHGNICWTGVKEEVVCDPKELMSFLRKGSIARTTASTDMNHNSSRSHAIFSVVLRQFHQNKKLVSKFHFVDLAGSERLKRTNAVGDRAREGISINSGLLALGNVISALGDESRRVSHIPYRDSKLTRLLQDSLGGNSQTLMLACASPADINVTETLNTLKYANRARNIRNRVAVNQEMGETEKLKQTITRLKEEIRSNDDFLHAVNNEMDALKREVQVLSTTLQQKSIELACVKCERDQYKHQLMADDQGLVPPMMDDDQTLVNDHPLVTEYAQIIESLKIELLQTQEKLKLAQERQHDDDETLVGSPCHSSNQCPPVYVSDKTSSNKKRHRVGKRSKYNKKKNTSFTTTTAIAVFPKQQKKNNKFLQEIKRKLQKEIDFLKQHQFTCNEENEVPNTKYRRRTLGSIHTDLQRNNNENSSQTLLLQKLGSMIDTQHELIQQLEQASQAKDDLSFYHAQKLAELNTKKNMTLTHHKRELADLKAQYECRLKKQQVELQTLRRKHMQLMSKTDRMRHQSQSLVDQLNRTVEKLGREKKKTTKRMKQESDRAREKMLEYEKALGKAKKQEAQSVTTKKRLEREIGVQKVAYKRLTEEMVGLMGQMKQVAAIVKKLASTNPKLDMTGKALLAKALTCANVRGYHAKPSTSKKTSGKLKAATLQQRVFHKKKIINSAIAVFVKDQAMHTATEDIARKRNSLVLEQKELLAERKLVLTEAHKKDTFSFKELSETQYMDERIDTITLELSLLDHQLQLIQRAKENDSWTDDMDNREDAYETALSLIRTLEYEEARLISELFMEELIQLKKTCQFDTLSTQPMGSMLQSLQAAVVQVRRITSSRELDPILMRILNNSIQIQHGLLLPKI